MIDDMGKIEMRVASILGISEPKEDDRVWQFGTY